MVAVRATLDGTEAELSASWPDASFKDVLENITVKAGVLAKESTKPVCRVYREQEHIGMYVKTMIYHWLRLRAVYTLTQLKQVTHTLGQRGQTVQRETRSIIKEYLSEAAVSMDTLSVADMMMAGDFVTRPPAIMNC